MELTTARTVKPSGTACTESQLSRLSSGCGGGALVFVLGLLLELTLKLAGQSNSVLKLNRKMHENSSASKAGENKNRTAVWLSE